MLFRDCYGVEESEDTADKFCMLYDNSNVTETLIGDAQQITPGFVGHFKRDTKCDFYSDANSEKTLGNSTVT